MPTIGPIYKERFAVDNAAQLAHAPAVHQALYRAWSCRREQAAGGLPQFDVMDLPGEVLAHLAYSDVVDGGADFRLRVIGEVLAATLKTPFVGRLTSEMPFSKDQIALILEENSWAATQGKPLYVRRHGAARDLWEDMTRLIVPVSDGAAGRRLVMSFFIVDFTDNAIRKGLDKTQTAPIELPLKPALKN